MLIFKCTFSSVIAEMIEILVVAALLTDEEENKGKKLQTAAP